MQMQNINRPNPVPCTRSGCVNNEGGFCGLEAPRLVHKLAFTDCLDHKNK